MDRASWIPIVHDFFTRMWLVTAVAALGIDHGDRALALGAPGGATARAVGPARAWRNWWCTIPGNERRYIMFIPALIAPLFARSHAARHPISRPSLLETRGARWAALPACSSADLHRVREPRASGFHLSGSANGASGAQPWRRRRHVSCSSGGDRLSAWFPASHDPASDRCCSSPARRRR